MKKTIKNIATGLGLTLATILPMKANADVTGHLNYNVTPDTREVRASVAGDHAKFNFREEGEDYSAHLRLAFPQNYLGGELWLRETSNGSAVAASITPEGQFVFPAWVNFDENGEMDMFGTYASGSFDLGDNQVFYAGEKNWYPESDSDDAWFAGAARDSVLSDYRLEGALINHYSQDKWEASASVSNADFGGLVDYVTTPDSWSTSLWLATEPGFLVKNGPHVLGNLAPGEMAETRTHFTPTHTKGDLSARVKLGDSGDGLDGFVEAGKSFGDFGFTVGTTFDGDLKGALTYTEGNFYGEAQFQGDEATLYGSVSF